MKKHIALVLFITGLLTLNLAGQTLVPVLVSSPTNNLLKEPYGVAVDGANTWYITDSANNRIFLFSEVFGTNMHLAGSLKGTPGYQDDPNGIKALFFNPQGIVLVQNSYLIVADSGNHVLRKVTTNGVVTTLAGAPQSAGTNDGVGLAAKFNSPAGLAVDPSNNNLVYIADVLNNAIRTLNLANNTVATLPIAANLLRPSAVALRSDNGDLYVADTGHHVIRVRHANGTITTYGQVGNAGFQNDLADPAGALFNSPSGLLWDKQNGLLVADTGNGVIRRIFDNPTYGTTSVETYVESTASASLMKPVGLAKDTGGNFAVIDLGKNSAYLIQLTEPQEPLPNPIIGQLVPLEITNSLGQLAIINHVMPINTATNYDNDVVLAIFQNEPRSDTFFGIALGGQVDNNAITNPVTTFIEGSPWHSGTQSLIDLNNQSLTNAGQFNIKAISTQIGRKPSDVIGATVSFSVGIPAIGGNNANSFTLSETTTNALLCYTTDGSAPIPENPSAVQILNANALPVTLSLKITGDTTFTVQGYKSGYASSGPITKVFKFSDYVTTRIGVTNDYVAAPGSTLIVPIQVNPLEGDVLRSLQFRVEVAPLDAATPAITTQFRTVKMSTNDFIPIAPPNTNEFQPFVTPADTYQNSLSTLSTFLEVSYVGITNGLELSQPSVVAILAIPIPPNATSNQKYTLGIKQPSATSDGRSTPVFVGAMPDSTITVSNNLYYLVGDSAIANWYNASATNSPGRTSKRDFGDNDLANNDVNNAFNASLGVFVPYEFSDAFDAMDAFPVDSPGNPGGDGQIRFLDWQIILSRSLRSPNNPYSTNWYWRAWINGQKTTVGPVAPVKTLLGLAGKKLTKNNQPNWFCQALMGALTVENAEPGHLVSVPVYIKVAEGYEVAGLQFRAMVTPVNGAPDLTVPIQFIAESGVPNPMPAAMQLPVNQMAGAWSLIQNPLTPAVQSLRRLGRVNITIPASAQTGQQYVVRFANADGAPNLSTQYDFETLPATIWVGTAAQKPAEVISDEWKTHFFGSYANPWAADDADADNTGVPNLTKYLTGQNPVKPRLHVLSTEWASNLQDNRFKLRWFAAPGKRYVIEKSANSANATWNKVADEVGQGTMREILDTLTPDKAQFYRLNELQP